MILLLFMEYLQTEKARLVPVSCAQSHAVSTRYAGLPDHPKRDTILPCREDGDCISFDWSMRQTQESGIRRLVLVGCRSFSFPELYLFEMRLINYDDQRLRFLVILGNELLRLGQEVDLAGSGEVLHKVFGADTDPVVFHTRRKIVAR